MKLKVGDEVRILSKGALNGLEGELLKIDRRRKCPYEVLHENHILFVTKVSRLKERKK